MTFNIMAGVGTVLVAPERFNPNRGQNAQVSFRFGIESDSKFGLPALREATVRVFLLGGRAEWAMSNLGVGYRVLVKGRLADLEMGNGRETVIVADWIEVISRVGD